MVHFKKIVILPAGTKPAAPAKPFDPRTNDLPTVTTSGPLDDGPYVLYNDGARPGTFKVWKIARLGTTVEVSWGRDGSTLQHKTKQFLNEMRAKLFVNDMLGAKRKKGYRIQR